jgi:hypothetical protein
MATLFITIGPQCCGKTSFLQAHGIVDINMDSVPGTYESLSLEVLFKYSSDDPRQFSLEENQIYEQKLHGLTIAERIEQLAQSECYALILFFHEVSFLTFAVTNLLRGSPEISSTLRSNTSVNSAKKTRLLSLKLPQSYSQRTIEWSDWSTITPPYLITRFRKVPLWNSSS